MTIFIGADHRGFEMKKLLIEFLQSQSYQVVDCGNTTLDPDDDYPDFAVTVAQKVATESDSRGIVLCGSGVGASIAANKVRGVRAAVGVSLPQVQAARHDDDINVLSCAANFTTIEELQSFAVSFLSEPFGAEPRYVRRLMKIAEIETK